jgi:hypothetical protein
LNAKVSPGSFLDVRLRCGRNVGSVQGECEHTFALNSNLTGAVAEIELAAAAVRLGVPVFTPLAEHGRSDLVLEVAGRLWRVQCKWASVSAAGDILLVRTGTRRLSTRGYLTTTYDASQIDYFGVYCGDLDRCFSFAWRSPRASTSSTFG